METALDRQQRVGPPGPRVRRVVRLVLGIAGMALAASAILLQPFAASHLFPGSAGMPPGTPAAAPPGAAAAGVPRSEEHTSELQSHLNLVCRLLLEKKNQSRARPPRSRGRIADDRSRLRTPHPPR